MRSVLPVLGIACLLGDGLAGPGCRSSEPGNCGRPTPGGEIRFCSDSEDDYQICICGTGRCARTTGDEVCDFGLRYVYGDEECVSEQDLMSGGYVASSGAGGVCLDVPTVRPPMRYAEPLRVDPRLIRFDDRVLLETVTPYPIDDPPDETSPAQVFVHRLSWEGRPEGESEVFVNLRDGLPGARLAVRGARSWGVCDAADPSPHSAVFAHWVVTDTGRRPILLRASFDSGHVRLDDITDRVFDTAVVSPGRILDLRVVGTTNGCWIAWIEDPDGSGERMAMFVRGRRIPPNGTVSESVQDLIPPRDGVEFLSAGLFPDDPPQPGLMAADDGQGGVVVAVPAQNRSARTVGLWARGIRQSGMLFPGESVEVAQFGPDDPNCGSAICRGLAYPEFNGVAAQGDRIYFAYVLENSDGSRRKLFLSTADGDLIQTTSPAPIDELRSPLAGPTILPRPDGGVFGAVMGWNGDFAASAAPLHLFRVAATATGIETMETHSLPDPTAVLPLLAVDDGGFLLLSYATLQGGAANGLRLTRRFSTLHAPAPTWPPEGMPYAPPTGGSSDIAPGGLLSSSVATPLPRPDGGALVAWTTRDQHVEIALVEAVQ
ncbi:MAG: hypothetical protein GYA57_03445 [Myxococcales bacterium]|nr:hypothetical protein [Myxococcales bacterium]